MVNCEVCGSDLNQLQQTGERIRDLLGEDPVQEEDPRVPAAFWSAGGIGGSATWRRLELPALGEIDRNYPGDIRDRLQELAQLDSDTLRPGRLLLWHGEAGTGKTWALRALAQEWRSWCTLNYITDPERLFGGDASYLFKLLLDRPNNPFECEPSDQSSWNLIVIEDASEYLAIDSHHEVRQAFSRLLNTLDGLIGQGGNNLILITTNEPLGKLHPAILRPGRLLGEIEFRRFSAVEATDWLLAHGVEHELDHGLTLAEAYDALERGQRAQTSKAIGFR
jgi:hypothetical protein